MHMNFFMLQKATFGQRESWHSIGFFKSEVPIFALYSIFSSDSLTILYFVNVQLYNLNQLILSLF